MKPFRLLGLLVLCIWAAPVPARTEATCDAAYAQTRIRQGFSYLNAHDWADANHIGNQLAAYTGNCNNNLKVQNPTAVYAMYFVAYSLHEMGDDPHAEEAVAAGLRALEQLKAQGGYTSLYDNVRPLFVEVQGKIAGHYQ
jgi:hypothetical protein